MVQDVVGLLADLLQHVEHARIHLPEPGMPGIELVAEQQSQRAGGLSHFWSG